MVSHYEANPTGRITVRCGPEISEAGLRDYLERLLPGLASGQAIVIVDPSSITESPDAAAGDSSLTGCESGRAGAPSYVDRLATAGALLICGAVVFNLVPLAGPRMPSAGQPFAVLEADSRSTAVSQPAIETARAPTVQEPEAAAAPPNTAVQLPFPPGGPIVQAAFSNMAQEAAPPVEPPTPPTQSQTDPAESAASPRNTIVGVWAPDAGTCSAHQFRDGALPTVITTDGASAGDTFCIFTKQQETEAGLRVVAKCSSPRERWTSQVRLTVSEQRLTWSSKRGVQHYARCTPDLLMAKR